MSEAQAALVAALGELTNPGKDSTADTGKFRYDYTSLPALLDHVRPVLAAHGFALVQQAVTDAPLVGVHTELVHTSGEVFDGGTLLLPGGNSAQTAGSALTYARRYAICAVLGIAGDDDDGVGAARDRATGGYADTQQQPPPAATAAPPDSAAVAAPSDDGPLLPVGGGPVDWRKAAQRLTKAWKRNVTQTDAQQAVIEQLKREDVGVKKPSDVNEDLANHALRALEQKGAPV